MGLIDKLVQVSEIDARRIAVQRKLDAVPAPLRDFEAKIESAKGRLTREKDEAKKGGLEIKRLEGEVKAKQQEIEKCETARNTSRSNDEFQALGKKIAGLQKEVGDFEMKILEEMERQDARDKGRAPLEKQVKEIEAELKVARTKVDAEVKVLKEQLAKIDAERKESLGILDKDQRAIYDKAIERHGDRAVVPVQDNYCQGCLVKIRPNQAAQLKGGDVLVTCWECGRILYSG
jgi:predicted  nucleic acid-binding Zn-ribbon protein